MIYENSKYSFLLSYQVGLKVSEFDEGGGAMTITFEDTEVQQGFQIFVLPYGENKISETRFLADIPSGVIENVREATIDGVKAVIFDSKHTDLGETFEVWFIKGGLLYEVSTLRQFDSWLLEILTTWEFITP